MNTFADVYNEVLQHILWDGVPNDPRGLRVLEAPQVVGVKWDIGPTVETIANRTSEVYLAAELMWYYEARDDAAAISKYASHWDKIKNTDGTVNSAYGQRLFRPQLFGLPSAWMVAYARLKDDPKTRRAWMPILNPMNVISDKDVPCTIGVSFKLDDGGLHTTAVMRSQDIWWGLPYDAPFFASLGRNMAYLIGVPPGECEVVCLNMHLYEKDRERATTLVHEGIIPGEAWPAQTHPWLDEYGTTTEAYWKGDALAERCRSVSGWS